MNRGTLRGFGKLEDQDESTTLIVNAHSSGGFLPSENLVNPLARSVLSGMLVAGEPKVILEVKGKGVAPLLSATSNDSTARTIRLIVRVDGGKPFDATTASFAVANRGIVAAGAIVGSSFVPGEPIKYKSSLSVSVASSLSETDKVSLNYILHGR